MLRLSRSRSANWTRAKRRSSALPLGSGTPGNDWRRSVEECRRLLGKECCLTDDEVLRLRDQLYTVANVVVSLVPEATSRESMDERAAIMEIDGGLSRVAANRSAMILHMKGRSG